MPKTKFANNSKETISRVQHLENVVVTLQSQIKEHERGRERLDSEFVEVHESKDTALNILREEYTYHVLRSLALKRELENFGIVMP